MESSDESFLWTDASDDIDSDTKMVAEERCDIESESGTSYKKKIHKELFSSNIQENYIDKSSKNKKSKKRKLSEDKNYSLDQPKRKHIKSEPESDMDKPLKKLENNSTLCDEDFLNNKVKEEQLSRENETPKLKTKKSKKHKVDNDHSPNQTESIAFLEPLDNCTVINISESINGHNESNVEDTLVKDSIRTKKKKSKKINNQKFCESQVLTDNNRTETTEEDNTMDSIVLNKFCKKEVENEIFHNNFRAPEDDQSIIEKEYESDISKINSSQLNTTVNKKIKRALLSNGKSKDIILSFGGVNSKLSQSMSNIADRIRFEDENSTDINNDNRTYARNQYTAQLQKYFKTNGLVCVSSPHVSDCVISDDDEVWILNCPTEIDVKNLMGSSIVLDSKCKLKVDSQTYVGFNESSTNNTTILTLSEDNPVIKNIAVNGLIHFHKRIPKPHFVEDYNVMSNQANFIPLPETKFRHPLFGVNYKKCIKVPKHIAKRLRNIESECISQDKIKNPKKNKQKIESDLLSNQTEFKVEPEVRHKKKKRKHSRDSITPPKSVKRRKHNLESDDTWESEKAIEQQLFSF